jgi:hypothetical protein
MGVPQHVSSLAQPWVFRLSVCISGRVGSQRRGRASEFSTVGGTCHEFRYFCGVSSGSSGKQGSICHIFTISSSYLHHIFIIYSSISSSYIHHIFIISSSYLHHIFIISSSYLHHIFIISSSYLHHIFVISSSYVHHIFIICSSYFIWKLQKI